MIHHTAQAKGSHGDKQHKNNGEELQRDVCITSCDVGFGLYPNILYDSRLGAKRFRNDLLRMVGVALGNDLCHLWHGYFSEQTGCPPP